MMASPSSRGAPTRSRCWCRLPIQTRSWRGSRGLPGSASWSSSLIGRSTRTIRFLRKSGTWSLTSSQLMKSNSLTCVTSSPSCKPKVFSLRPRTRQRLLPLRKSTSPSCSTCAGPHFKKCSSLAVARRCLFRASLCCGAGTTDAGRAARIKTSGSAWEPTQKESGAKPSCNGCKGTCTDTLPASSVSKCAFCAPALGDTVMTMALSSSKLSPR
mmetsp:Transcript_69958/g.167069  ORF Transcript_69958/g.167069 Transcript_69958/m.167069 type:complete len:213 (-) Transcript_69958:501-1139(-)